MSAVFEVTGTAGYAGGSRYQLELENVYHTSDDRLIIEFTGAGGTLYQLTMDADSAGTIMEYMNQTLTKGKYTFTKKEA